MKLSTTALLSLVGWGSSGLVAADVVGSLTGKGFSFTYPGQPNFDSASAAFNLRYTYRPAIVAFPTTTQHVSDIVKVGKEEGYNVVGRSGGHSYVAAGLGGKNGSIVIDMGHFTELTYDSTTQTAVIGVGNRLGKIVTALNANGRALPHGTCAYVGWGGHATYGGYGFTARMWGMAVDSVISMDVVLANGTIAKTSKTQNADLFWALKGAAGSFGVVTSTKVKTFPAPASASIYGYWWNLDIDAATRALANYQKFSRTNIPKELGIEVVLVPGSGRGFVTFGISGGWYGAANRLNATLKSFLDTMPGGNWGSVDVGDYLNSAKNLAGGSLDIVEGGGGSDTFYVKSLVSPQASPMSDQAMRAFITYIANTGSSTNVGWFLQLGLVGGQNSAVNAIPRDETSYPHRDALYIMQLYAYANGNRPPFPAGGFTFVNGIVDSIVKNSPSNWDYGAYSNYIDDRLPNAEQLYYKSNLPRLKELKAKYDPTGVFNSPVGVSAR